MTFVATALRTGHTFLAVRTAVAKTAPVTPGTQDQATASGNTGGNAPKVNIELVEANLGVKVEGGGETEALSGSAAKYLDKSDNSKGTKKTSTGKSSNVGKAAKCSRTECWTIVVGVLATIFEFGAAYAYLKSGELVSADLSFFQIAISIGLPILTATRQTAILPHAANSH